MFDEVHEDFLAGREYQQAAQDRHAAQHGAAPPTPPPDRRRVYLDRTAAHVLFADRVMRWHRPVLREGWPPMCSCGDRGRHCRYLAAAQEILGARLPWSAP